MYSHVVIFWTDPNNPNAADEMMAGAEKYLRPIPGILHFHVGKMARSERPVVDQSYQVALVITFKDRQAEADYQKHPSHLEFTDKIFWPRNKKFVIYDFE